ncbi:hypothetical protein [Kitasatospora cathayae]|uniref:Tetracycline repressor TetR C-terminal domain-containing protein n=1 Tax=Kitasatospora cathayae TaxID=3004092 RepID=A0ABY7QHQ8_9ACTN|nr:hypothetical protein [Kitasatospora sp. HUAS 3-15]WBP91902.1 hypothetical protein O1G21_00115 [Kitasatospora sp. HUAS 3-15]
MRDDRPGHPYVQQLLESGEYPMFGKIAVEARQPRLSRDDQFRTGLERVLDCIAAALPSGDRGRPS